jgi:hypothetical protein
MGGRRRSLRLVLAGGLVLGVIGSLASQLFVEEDLPAAAQAQRRDDVPETRRSGPSSDVSVSTSAGRSGSGVERTGESVERAAPTGGSPTTLAAVAAPAALSPDRFGRSRSAAPNAVTPTTVLTAPFLPTSLPSSTLLPTSLPASTVAVPRWRLATIKSYAEGALVARPLDLSAVPNRGRSVVTKQASLTAAARFGGTVKPAAVDVFFAEYDAPLGEWLGRTDSTATEAREVWFVVFANVEGKRATNVFRTTTTTLPADTNGVVPTTQSLTVFTDLVVVIDDETGEVLVVSEFLADPSSLRS